MIGIPNIKAIKRRGVINHGSTLSPETLGRWLFPKLASRSLTCTKLNSHNTGHLWSGCMGFHTGSTTRNGEESHRNNMETGNSGCAWNYKRIGRNYIKLPHCGHMVNKLVSYGNGGAITVSAFVLEVYLTSNQFSSRPNRPTKIW